MRCNDPCANSDFLSVIVVCTDNFPAIQPWTVCDVEL